MAELVRTNDLGVISAIEGPARRRRHPVPGHGPQHECPRGLDHRDPDQDPGPRRARGRSPRAARRGRARPLAASVAEHGSNRRDAVDAGRSRVGQVTRRGRPRARSPRPSPARSPRAPRPGSPSRPTARPARGRPCVSRADLHAGDVDAGLAEDPADGADHAGPVGVAEEREVLGGLDVDVVAVDLDEPLDAARCRSACRTPRPASRRRACRAG